MGRPTPIAGEGDLVESEQFTKQVYFALEHIFNTSNTPNDKFKLQRQRWIDDLRAGENPFTPD